jgi:hypothetical protein
MVSPPFVPILRIYPGGDPADASTWGTGSDISAYIRHPGSDGGQPITYSGGRQNEGSGVDAGSMSLTLDNRTGIFSTRNPNGTWYGNLRRGTPIVLSMASGSDTFTRADASGLGTSSGGGVWSSSATWSISSNAGNAAFPSANAAAAAFLGSANSTNADFRVTVWPTVAATGAALIYGVMLRATDSQNGLLVSLEFSTGGAVDAKVRTLIANVASTLDTAAGIGSYVANDKWRMRVQALGPIVRIKAWKPANPSTPDADEPEAWTASGVDGSVTGSRCGFYFWRLVGNTNAGTVNFKMDDVSVEAIEFAGSVVQWPVRWDKTGGNSWAPIQAAGILRRLRQGESPLKSPLTRQLPTYTPTGHWPLEDGSDAKGFGSTTAGVSPAVFTIGTLTPAADSTLAGASTAPVFSTAGATIRGTARRKSTGDGFSFMFFMKLNALPATKTKIATIGGVEGLVGTWNIYLDAAGTQLLAEARESDGTLVDDDLSSIATNLLHWNAFQLEAQNIGGGTITWNVIYHEVGLTTYWSVGGSYASSTTPRVLPWTVGGTDLNGAAFSHVLMGEQDLPFVDDTFSLVSDGYRGELASDRIARLCEEEGLSVGVETGDSEPMGPQQLAALTSLLQDAADADYGILYEHGPGLGYRPRSARYSRSVTFDLAVASGEVAEPPEPIEDDQRVRNEWAISRVDGSTVTAIDATHQALEGRYDDSATLNVETDGVLADHAAWRVYLGTRPELRWPGLEIDLARNASLIETWRSAGFSPRITVTTGLTQVTEAADPDVFGEGYAATLWPSGWRVVFNCVSAGAWDVPALDSGVRLDTDGSELASGVDADDVSWSVTTTSGPVWVTSGAYPAEFPFTITCEGEEVSVTAITSTTSPQTFTVTRSTNGIAKAHSAGADINLADPTHLAL